MTTIRWRSDSLVSSCLSLTFTLLLLAAPTLANHHRAPRIILTEDGRSSAPTHQHASLVPPPVVVVGPRSRITPPSADQLRSAHHASLARPALYEHLHHPDARIAARAQSNLNCTICETLVALLEPQLFKNATEAIILDIAIVYCEATKPLCHTPAACAEVCSGIIGEYASVVWAIAQELITPSSVCAILKQCPAPPTPSPSTAIPVPSDLQNLNGEIAWPSWDLTEGTGTFIHLSDGHIDLAYEIGSLAGCGLPICW
jgi:hypothetical protein